MSEDEVVDSIMGYDSEQQLSEVQLQYREKLKRKIAKVSSLLFAALSACLSDVGDLNCHANHSSVQLCVMHKAH